MNKPKVVVTRRWPAAVEAALTERFDVSLNPGDRPLTPYQLRDAMLNADAVLPTVTDRIDASVLDLDAPRARILANYGIGYGHIDIDAARHLQIAVTHTPDVLSECTADLTFMLMLMAARRAGEGECELRGAEWEGWHPTHMLGTKVSGKTLGLIGFGRVGQAVARRAHWGFGMEVVAYDPAPIAPETYSLAGVHAAQSMEEVLAAADFVSLHCSAGPENRHLIDAFRLDQMKPDAFLINTASGGLIDEQALVHAHTSRTAPLQQRGAAPKSRFRHPRDPRGHGLPRGREPD
jgi:glyoxylate reductase